jgi:hypothetical protein
VVTATGPQTAPIADAAARPFLPPPVPALVVGSVSHTRRTPLVHTFTYRHYQWLVDLDDLPQLRRPMAWLARFDAADHLDGGRLGGGTRGDLERFLEHRGVTLASDDRVLMLAHARVLGHTFDPMSAFWCLRADGSVRAVVIEVHNTYGDRHAYLLDVDAAGRATQDKELYVSPFNDASGTYRMRLELRPERVAVAIRLLRGGRHILDAGLSGVPLPLTTRTLLSTFARHALITQRVTALIRIHGIWLWLRRLPVLPRPQHSPEAVR